jgi:quinol monooxygenase YgiN
MIHVIATIQLHPGKRDAFLEIFRALVPVVHREEGCIEYGPAIDFDAGIGRQPPNRDDAVTVIEKWDSVDALKAHLAAAHMQTFREQVADIVTNIEVRTFRPAG